MSLTINSKLVISDLEHNRKRLEYYVHLKTKTGPKNKSIDNWIAVYSERVTKLERQASRLQAREKRA
ncbi:MAG: hypothetical protein ACXWPM_01480 [Bdellovibrionota bacterium]